MAINKKLIHFKNKENFNTEVANNNILDNSIVFIQDSKEISTHGTIYNTVNWGYLKSDWVDMGLPSGTLWRNRNLGSDNTNDVGLVYEWGGTLGYRLVVADDDTFTTIPEGKTFSNSDSKWASVNEYGTVTYTKYNLDDRIPELELIDDIAYLTDNSMRIPSFENWQELFANCLVTTTENGYYLTSKINNNFLQFINGYDWICDGSCSSDSGGNYMSRNIRYDDRLYTADEMWADVIYPKVMLVEEGSEVVLPYRFAGYYIRPIKYVE